MGAVAQRRQRIAVHFRRRGRAGFAAGGGVFGAVSPAAVNGRSAACATGKGSVCGGAG